jgi:CarD family transcriptional regulator
MKFKTGDKVVFPGHGVGTITKCESKDAFGKVQEFFTIQLNGLKVMAPASNVDQMGLRRISSKAEILKTLSNIKTHKVDYHPGWQMRYRELLEKIKSGNFVDICEVLSHLRSEKDGYELSFGERKLLDLAKTLAIEEVSLALGLQKNKAEEFINEKIG